MNDVMCLLCLENFFFLEICFEREKYYVGLGCILNIRKTYF